ncbi:MFS transporter [Alkalicoccobacillus plakortidis]|uniref:MFS transporter n=1 Tax=Alkalicoccobacillus plakortidis TaxID=444060 RepID=A0ABT0XNG2_9BACI|nr:MFS transporter [Alkalicoccobacillus plakortidis]MCM2677447.1 MFS transporter [Alkalicoccobacillus plakortidis]
MDKKEIKRAKKEQKALERAEREQKFRRAKTWELFMYPTFSIGHNGFMFLMTLVSYYAAGIVGLGTVVASYIISGSRIFDGITDPLIALIIDKTKGKYGKIRILFASAYFTMSLATVLLFFTNHLVADGFKLFYFILLYIVFIIGYTLSGIAGNIGNNLLTNDPQQRPVFGGLNMIYSMLFYSGVTLFLTVYLTGKYSFSDVQLFHEMTIFTLIITAIGYGLSSIAIRSKDKIENFGEGKNTERVKFRDLWPMLKGNRPLQLFVVTMATDKLSLQVSGNVVANVMLFGIVIGNYAMLGITQSLATIPNILVLFFGIRYAMKFGSKKGYVLSTWGCLISYGLLFLLLWLGDPTQIRMDNMGFMTLAFITLFTISGAVRFVSSSFVQPMLADVVDYNTYKSNRYAPGLVSAIYTFIDKAVSSLQQTVIGLLLAFIGFRTAFPDVDTPYTEKIFWMTMFLNFGILIISWTLSLIVMKYYELNKERMVEIQEILEERSKGNTDDPDLLAK